MNSIINIITPLIFAAGIISSNSFASEATLELDNNLTWEQAFPRIIVGGEDYKYDPNYFREAYVKYAIVDDQEQGSTLIINLRDQFARQGYWFERQFSYWIGRRLAVFSLTDSILERMFRLIARDGLGINIDIRGPSFRPNFDLLDELMTTGSNKISLEKVAFTFAEKFPNIKQIKFWIGTLEQDDLLWDRNSDALSIAGIVVLHDVHEPWTQAFLSKDIHVDFENLLKGEAPIMRAEFSEGSSSSSCASSD